MPFVGRHSCFFWFLKAFDRTAQFLNQVFESFRKHFGNTVKIITVDSGKEFTQYRSLEQRYDLTDYFCYPYSPL